MFTGIIEEMGIVEEVTPTGLLIAASVCLKGTKVGDSSAVNGACLTVTDMVNGRFSVDVVPETLRRTNLGKLQSGDQVNLERALTPTTRMGGHFVQGHVDGTGRLSAVIPDGDAVLVKFEIDERIARYIVEKGFIAIDGVSLTVVSAEAASFSVTLIPFTRANTNLGARQLGDEVNLEIDILAKYVERFLRVENAEAVRPGGEA
ncbi:riboflavin synthase [Dehalococcoidia bacterium]|nr:riboflavin synthase [Dehalococcoidia bacterium]